MVQSDRVIITHLQKILLAAVIYALATIPGKLLLMLLPGAEVRFSACLPVVFGMLWGLPGAIGTAVGNIVSDLYSGETISTIFWGCLSNFILSCLPYRLWYGWHGKKAHLFIYNAASCLRFFIIVFITVFNFSALLCAIVILNFSSIPLQSFRIFFSSNYDFTLLFGVPILLWLRKNNYLFSLPRPNPRTGGKKAAKLPLAALLISSFFSFMFLLGVYYEAASSTHALLFLAVNAALLLYSCRLTPDYDVRNYLRSSPDYYSIGAKATMIILLLAIVTIIFIIALLIGNTSALTLELNKIELWRKIFSTLLLSMHFVFIVVLIILYKLEKTVVAPITRLSRLASSFVENNYLDPVSSIPDISQSLPKNEIDELLVSFRKMTADVQNYLANWQTVTKENEAIAAQLAVGAQIQQSILPDPAIINQQIPGYEIKARMYPAKEVGGDLYDCFLLAPDKLAVLIADVSGKGIPAALFMMVTKTLLKSKSNLQDPATILAEVNNALAEHNDNMMFVTVWLGIVQLSTGKLTYANAGHNYPLLQQKAEPVILLKEKSGPALGIIPNVVYKNYEQTLTPDSKLLLYTDGIPEAENPHHEFFGMERLKDIFHRANVPQDVLSSLREFAAGAPPSDDITLLWLQRK